MRSFLTVFLAATPMVALSAKPNVVIIMADDIGYGDLGCYGATQISTPNLDRLATNGVRWTNAYAPASTSSPTRYALLTGEYAFRKNVGVMAADAPLAIDTTRNTLVRQLKSAGYTAGIVGKWHLGLGTADQPVDFNRQVCAGGMASVGFDYSFIFPATNDRVPTIFLENDKAVGLLPSDPISVSYRQQVGTHPTGKSNPEQLTRMHHLGHDGTIVNGVGRIGWQSGGVSAWWDDAAMGETMLAKAQAFVLREAINSNPFFLYYAPHNAHEPRIPNPKFAGRSKAGIYGDVIEEFDHYVGSIIETLRQAGVLDNTLIIITSDNGPMIKEGYIDGALENIGAHDPYGCLRGEKYSLYEGGVRVPFIISWPERIATPFVQEQRFCYVDLLATLSEVCDVKPILDGFHDSRSAKKLFFSPTAKPYRPYVVTQNNSGALAVRKGDMKYIPSKNALYDLNADPCETSDLAPSGNYKVLIEEFQQVVKQLKP